MKQTPARPKNGRPLQNPTPTGHDGFVGASPSRVLRDGEGTFTIKRNHCRNREAFPAFIENHVNYWPLGAAEVNFMSQDYLLKTEPSEYSFADLLRDAATEWEGVSNPAAVKNLREMSPGARLIIYETGARKSAVGTATVVSVDASDSKNPKVKIKAGKPIAKPVSLAEIKADKRFKDSPLVRMGRLSVVPLSKEQYKALAGA
jgi:predicted RNA-binding protein with PUA-like domain